MNRTTDRFWEMYQVLPEQIRRLANKRFRLLKDNPKHPSLQFKKVDVFWSVRISAGYRALALEDGNDFIWVWIGTHNNYEKIIRRK